MTPQPQIILFLEQLMKNCRINKHQHFHAAERNSFYNNIFGSVAIIINVFLGSMFVTLSQDLELSRNFANSLKWVSAFLAMLAATCGAIQTFFNFQKVSEGHHKIANRYLEIQRQCERILAKYSDNLIDLMQVAGEVELMERSYGQINIEAEAFPIGDRDYRKAMAYERKKSQGAAS